MSAWGRLPYSRVWLLAVSILGGLVALSVGWTAWALSDNERMAQAIERQSDVLERLEGAAQPFRAQMGDLSPGEATSAIYLTAATPAMAAAELQRTVAQIVERHGGSLSQFETLATTGDDARLVAVRASFVVDIAGLQSILFDIEKGAPLMLVAALDLRAQQRSDDMPEALLQVVMLVDGYMAGDES